MQLATESDREIADVDHFLHFAQCFALDLADLYLHKSREICFVDAQLRAKSANEFAAQRPWCIAPCAERDSGAIDNVAHVRFGGD